MPEECHSERTTFQKFGRFSMVRRYNVRMVVEELAVPYEVKRYERPQTMLAESGAGLTPAFPNSWNICNASTRATLMSGRRSAVVRTHSRFRIQRF
jgi:hypothetical protein